MEKKSTAITQAASAIEEQLQKFELLTASARRVPLTSQRNLEKAAQLTTEAAQCQEQLGGFIQAFMAALNVSREQNQETMNALQARADEIKERSVRLGGIKERVAELAGEAADISTVAQKVGQEKAQRGREALPELAEIEGRMTALVERLAALHGDCKDADFSDLSSQVESLKQQMQSARNKVKLVRQQLTGVTAEVPS